MLSYGTKVPIAFGIKRGSRAALGQLDEAPVFTIHGFCHRALLEGALEQATPFTFENLEDDEALQGRPCARRRGFYSVPSCRRLAALA